MRGMGLAVSSDHVNTTQDPKPEAISIQRAAIILDVHENTIYNWIRSGYLKAIKIGPRIVRIPRSELSRLRTTATISPNTTQ